MQEIEVKFLDINPADIEAKLISIGALKVGEYFYRRRVFDYPDWRLDKASSWLRLRDEGERVTLSFKQRLGVGAADGKANDDGMNEIEIEVSDFDRTAALLLSTGLVEKHYLENKRTRWVKDEIEFDIDIYPLLPPYLEIEAPSWDKIDQAIALLELNPEDKKIFSANQVYALQGINAKDYVRLTFDEAVKRKAA